MTNKLQPAHLVLADGKIFTGGSFGYSGLSSGEVVFNTAMSGYQEILTDPSYFGQIVVMTYPHIGNYGIAPPDNESKKMYAAGLIVRDYPNLYSNYRAKSSLQAVLKKAKVFGLAGIDTRALVRHIRDAGAMPALLATATKYSPAQLKKMAQKLPSMDGQNLAQKVSCVRSYAWNKGVENFIIGAGQIPPAPLNKGGAASSSSGRGIKKRFNIIAYDFGIKQNILRLLVDAGANVTVVPYDYSADKILNATQKVDGVFLSNGPGDPATCTAAIDNVKKLLGKKPIFGICLGHQILAQALGAKTYKLKFGHHGANHPVMDLATRKVEITSQNHGYAVDDQSLPNDVKVTHVNLNDHTVEGLQHQKLRAFSVQYHPEAAPGPHDSRYLFERFFNLMR